MVASSWVVASLLSLSGCKGMSVDQETQLGTKAAADIEKQVRLDTGERAVRVARIGRSVGDATGNRDYTFTYKVISDAKVNAFAIPGGKIYIYSGMLDRLNNDDELAGVLSHETIHVTHRHFVKQNQKNSERQTALAILLGATKAGGTAQSVVGLADLALSNDYSRQDETDADLSGMDLMKRAGYSPHGMVQMLQVLQQVAGNQPGLMTWTSDHPQISERIRKAQIREAELSRR